MSRLFYYRDLTQNKLQVIGDNVFNGLPSLSEL